MPINHGEPVPMLSVRQAACLNKNSDSATDKGEENIPAEALGSGILSKAKAKFSQKQELARKPGSRQSKESLLILTY